MNATEKSSLPTTSSASPVASPAGLLSRAELAGLAQQFKQAMQLKSNAPDGLGIERSDSASDPITLPAAFLPLVTTPAHATPSLPNANSRPSLALPSVAAAPTRDTFELPITPGFGSTALVTAGLPRELKPEPTHTDEAAPDTLGAAMLQSLQQQGAFAVVPAPPLASSSPVEPAPRVQSLESVVAETVSRVLVSDPLHDGAREVRIEFAREVLPDTEVRLWRDGGRLHVEFVSPSAVAENGLRDALPRLGDAIQQRQSETTAPVVSLRLQESGAGGQPGDGRSRQQYRTPEEIEGLA